MKRPHIILILSLIPQLASASSAVFYNQPASWLFDLIQKPTSTRQFNMIDDGATVGCTQIQLGPEIQCTIHGKTAAYPKSSADSQLALCTVNADSVDSIFSQDEGGSISFSGNAAQSIFGLLPTTNYSIHDSDYKQTITFKTYSQPKDSGIQCTEAQPDVVTTASPVTYNCSISWNGSQQPSGPTSVGIPNNGGN